MAVSAVARQPNRILIVDDHALFRQSVAHVLSADTDLSIRHCARIEEALQMLSEQRYDLVLLDNNLGADRGSDFLPAARKVGFEGFVIVLSAALSQTEARRFLRQGVKGIFLKQQDLSTFRLAIRTVMAGDLWLDASFAEMGKEVSGTSAKAAPRFTDVQRKVLRLILEGLSNKEIGSRHQISESYVKAIIQTLFQKTGVHTRGQLVRLALEQYQDQL